MKCSRCGSPRELGDNFCRRCGRQLTVDMPAVQKSNLPVASKGLPPSILGSVALLAVGTGLEWLARRMAGSAARAAGRALVSPASPPTPPARPAADERVVVDEVLYVRKVQLRR